MSAASKQFGEIRGALYNVPCVGDVYDQQHADTQLAAVLVLDEVEVNVRELAKAASKLMSEMDARFDYVEADEAEEAAFERVRAALKKIGGAK